MLKNYVIQQWILIKNFKKITLDDAMAADEIFEKLMGEEVEPRRKFIEDNAVLLKI
jgi:DNA gyrase subunit B